ncbi:MAG: YbaB/EbfC family nucleoid-associated protein [Chitinophagales bacterium]
MLDFSKAMELKKKMEEMSAKLDAILVDGEAGDGKYKVVATVSASKKMRNISLSDELIAGGDKEYMEDLILTAINRAMEQAQKVSEAEARSLALQGGFPGLGF